MSDLGDLITAGLIHEPNGMGLTWNKAHAVAQRIAARLEALGFHDLSNSLDAAWAEAEANGWGLYQLVRAANGWCASAQRKTFYTSTGYEYQHGVGPTPAAALRALTAKLRDEPHTK